MDTKSVGVSTGSIHRANELKGKHTNALPGENDAGELSKNSKNFNVSLSQEAQDLLQARQSAMQIAKTTSPIREDRVAALKAQISDGTYKIDSGKIADGMLIEAIKDEVSSGTEV